MNNNFNFNFNFRFKSKKHIEKSFKKIESIINLQIDENYNFYSVDNENIYQFEDVSNQSVEYIETVTKNFFCFNFDNIINTPLYKFLVLKNNDEINVLANIHSSIFDYTSINNLVDLFSNFKNTSLENNIISHHDDVNDYLNSTVFKDDVNFWKKYLLNAGNHIKFYNIKSNDNETIRISLENNGLNKFLKDFNLSRLEFVTAVFSLYLSRIDRTKGCLLNTVVHTNGFDKNTLLKIAFLKDKSFMDYLNEVKNAYDIAVEHTNADISNYVHEKLSYYSIYDFTKLKNTSVKNGEGSALTLNVYNDYLELIYNSSLFSDVYIQHMADNIESLIDNIIDCHDQILKEINILSDEEKEMISDFSKGKTIDVDKDKTLSMAFRENAFKYPDLIAVDDGVNQISYAKLEKSTNSAAYDLKNNYGVAFGECVGLMLPRTYHFPEMVLALNIIGAAFTPIDPMYPLKRIEHMLNISEAKHIITTKEHVQNIDLNVDVIYIEDLNWDYEEYVECVGGGDDLLAIIFTSGTTGLPKGVMASNKQLNVAASAFNDIFNTSVGDVIGYFPSFSFIASMRAYVSFIFGQCCRIFNEKEQKDSLLLIKTLKEQAMCDLILPPSLGVPIFENEDIKLKYLILAGAKLNELTNNNSNTKLVNFYGTTELMIATVNVYDLNNQDTVSIGKPVANNWAYILDGEGMQLPIGVPGEICISSENISPGYYNQPDLTDEVFEDNPYCTGENNRRLYHTGDIGYYNFKGEIEIIGREDDQLSVRGFRIESAEILNMMKSFKEISDVYLDVDYDNLIAYYTVDGNLDIDEVKNALKSELPYYMVPSLFIKLDKIPLNPNGKIDRIALKSIVSKSVDVEINDEILKSVLDIFKEVLNNDFVLVDDDFVELGGNSLSAMNMQRILKEELCVSLSSSEIVVLSTPINIANRIKFSLKAHSSIEVNYTFDDSCPLLESQLNVFLDEQINDMGTSYNNPFKIKFNKKYSFDEVENAVMKLLDLYPLLTARINEENDVLFTFDAKPSVSLGLSSDVDDFVKPFVLNESLARFLFIEDESLLCADFHHLIFDGTSLSIIIDALLDLLDGKIVDFIDNGFLRQISFEENIDSDYMESAKDFFGGMLVDLEGTSELLSSVKSDNDDNQEYMCSFDMDDNFLDSFLQDNSITRNQFFASVFAYTLSRFTGSSKVAFDLIEDGRGHIDLSESVGMFVRTLPLLVDCENQDVDSFIGYCARLVNSAMFYDLYPFRLLANEYGLNSNILFQYSHDLFYNVLNEDKFGYSVDELKHDLHGNMSFYIFNLNANKLGIRVLYSDSYCDDFIRHFVESYKRILNEMLNVDKLGDIDYVSSNDIEILDSYNKTEHDLYYDDILDVFNDNLSKYPYNKLVSYGDVSYTYAEGAFIVDKISKKLSDLGVKPQDCVSFFVERSELYMFCALGILSMGAIYVPLDDNLPDERIEFMIKDTNSTVLVVSDETYGRAKDLNDDNTILNISDLIDDKLENLSNLPNIYGDLACVLYTSGSTGLPKGVKITRKSILNFIDFHVNDLDILRDDVYGLFASIGFDVAMAAIFSSIYSGGCMNVIPDEIRLNINELNNHFVKYGVTHTYITTPVAKLFINEIESTPLKVLVAGGEKLGEINEVRDYRIVDAYGPTEACVYVISAATVDKIDSSSVGYVQNNTKAYILDDEFRRVPIGAVGELYLSGCQLADGYLNREVETANAFLTNPFENEERYSGLYRTGDMARLLPDGTYGIVGRRDSQVKIRGNRVELLEIEKQIRQLDYVDDVTLQAIKNGENTELVAYIVSSKDCSDDVLRNHVQNYVNEHKPEYMVPSFVIQLNEIPLNVNGKVDKKALPEVNLDSLHSVYAAPTSKTEEIIVDAFQSVFNREKVSVHDDFISLGGDSITAIRIISLLNKSGVSCTASDVLNYKTPHLIAQHAGEAIRKDTYDAVEGVVDLLPIQSYFFDQINKNCFSQQYVLKSARDLNKNILQKALDKLINIHDMLRASYKFKNGKAIQEISPLNSYVYSISEFDIEDNFNESIRDIISDAINALHMDNLIDVRLVHYAEECYVIFVIHHLIIDGVSWNILIDDLAYIYSQIENNNEINLLRPYPYKYWVNDVKSLGDNISDNEKQHWIEVNGLLDNNAIEGISKAFNLNFDISFDSDNLLMLSEEEYLALSFSRAYKKTYGEDIIFNRESYGRDESLADVSRTIGWFTSKFPVLVNVNGGNDDISLVSDVYNLKNAFKSVEHMGLNYASLIYDAGELEYKHCPVTFNFLSSEFSFKNELFQSFNDYLFDNDINLIDVDSNVYGITFNILRLNDSYVVSGNYAQDNYLGDKFEDFIENIRYELEFIGNYKFDNYVCTLSEPQLGIYLDEMVHDKGTAYSSSGICECGLDKSITDIENIIHDFISKHPILKGRILDTEDMPLFVCDRYPSIEFSDTEDYSTLIKPFDLNKSLARFYIIENNLGRFIFYDLHHIISDATTITIVNNELNSALHGELDSSVDLSFINASYDSFESKFDSSYKTAKEFFNSLFEDIDDVGFLIDDVNGSVGGVSLPIRGIRKKVEVFAHEIGITVGSLLNSVFAYTYSRFTGSDKVYYTFTEHGRHADYSQNAIGMYIHTVPIILLCKNKSVDDYLHDAANMILESLSHNIYPFRLIASEFGLSNKVGFEYNYNLNDVSSVGDDIILRDVADTVSEFSCIVNDLDDGFVVTVNHLDKFSQETAVRFVNVYKEVLTQFLQKNELKDIDYTSNEDIKLLDDYNQTEHSLMYEDILDAFNENLRKYPENKLVSMYGRSYSYAQGAFIADKIVKKLINLGIETGDSVALLVERSELYMFNILAILSIGAIYVPLDTKLPDERIQFILEDTESKVIIVSDGTYDRAKSLDEDFILLNISDIVNKDIGTLNELPAVYGDLACILYTSGTTGIPKGVKVTRKSALNISYYYNDAYGLTNDDVYGMFATIGFDAGSWAILSTICVGACLDVIPEDLRLDMKAMNDYFIKHNVTHTFITTPVGKMFVDSVEDTSLNVLVVGGEKLGEFASPENYELIDIYGPTEAFVFVASKNNIDKIDYSSVGDLIYNTKAYILDEEFRRVPVGAVGELYLAGDQIAKGYLNNEEETAYAFIDNPFDEGNYDVLYRTGDMVRVLPDNSLGVVGRRDSQVKIRGNRVELPEIEDVIREIEYVGDVTVQTVKHDGNKEVVAYVVVTEEFDESTLKDLICDYVGERKPEYMIPSFVMELDEIPLNVNGKIDKRALPEVDVGSLRTEYVAPTTEIEKDIVMVFEKVFNQDGIGINDDFVRLGGDSLTAIKLLSLLGEYNVTVADILSLHTPYAIAQHIQEKVDVDLDVFSVESGCPLNESQLNVYLDIVANDKVDSYIILLFMNIPRKYDIQSVIDALNEILNVHPILGMCVSDEFDVPYLVKGSHPLIMIENDDFDDEKIIEFLNQPFDLHDSLSRFLIIEKDDSYNLFSVFHHIVFDALSEVVFKQDLLSILNHESVDVDNSFLKVSAFTQQLQDTEEYVDASIFYESLLADSDDISVLLGSVLSDGPGTIDINLDLDYDLFKSFLREFRVSENVAFTGAFAYTLSRFVGSDKVLFNIIENGRDRFNNFNSIGMFVNTLPLLIDCKNQSISSFMNHMSNLVYAVMRYNYYPFRLLANEYNLNSDILFQFLPDWEDNESADINEVDLEVNIFNTDFSAQVIQHGNSYNFIVRYSDKYSSEFVERFVESYNLILQGMLNVSELADIGFITSSDVELLDEYNCTEHPLDYSDVLDAFNDNLSKYPENNLVSYNDDSYTYAEGAFIADKIAERLTWMLNRKIVLDF